MRIQRKLPIVFFTLAVMLVCMFVLLGQLRLRQAENRRWVLRTEDVLGELSSLLGNTMAADSAATGYLIAGQERHQVLYQTAAGETERALESLSRMLADNASQMQRLARLRMEIEENNQSVRIAREVRQKLGLAAAAGAFTESDSPRKMDRIRAAISELGGEE
ncbi:MAG TPA: CHASE3 domain-containing protein, partial [Bryobacteraceae bacterium]|nr:CHASE3 domain-containing protein [Bryobacteraceae bacterium]